MPCATGTREQIEDSRRRNQEERELERTDPLRKHWRALVERVSASDGSVASLSDDERLYYAVNVLDGEVHNGGFDQFFFNSSGDLYAVAELCLATLEAPVSLQLLRRAKAILFAEASVPVDTELRRAHLRARTDRSADLAALDVLDTEYYKDPDHLSVRVERFARERFLAGA